MEQELFKKQPLRLNNGRYCTKEQLRLERIEGRNKYLEYEREKCMRAWISLAKENTRLTQEINELKRKIKELI